MTTFAMTVQAVSDVAKQYGLSVDEAGSFLRQDGTKMSCHVVQQGNRIQVRVSGTDKLLFSCGKPQGIAVFIEQFWCRSKLQTIQ